jgi:hypothetical protein
MLVAVLSAPSSLEPELSLRLIQVDLCLLVDRVLASVHRLSLSLLLFDVQRLRHQFAFRPLSKFEVVQGVVNELLLVDGEGGKGLDLRIRREGFDFVVIFKLRLGL